MDLYYIQIRDIIQRVDNVAPPNLFQLQNTGKARFYGSELNVSYQALRQLKIGANYSFIRRENISRPELKFIDVPEHKLLAYLTLRPTSWLQVFASTEYNTRRYSTSAGTEAGGFALLNLNAQVRLHRWVGMEGGVNNLADRLYSLVEGFP
ncbi:MAG: TonB-dependent receptor, partial [Bacteroidia bacterium]|nr:TonB-dependent receptor [Bacteroidia bacterium]